MISENQKAVGDFWSARVKSTGNWWTNRMVVRDINRRVIGAPHAEVSRGALELGRELTRGRPLGFGISVGCGAGAKEIALIRGGFVERMLAYDLAESRIAQARRTAAELGLADRIEFRRADAFALHGPQNNGPGNAGPGTAGPPRASETTAPIKAPSSISSTGTIRCITCSTCPARSPGAATCCGRAGCC